MLLTSLATAQPATPEPQDGDNPYAGLTFEKRVDPEPEPHRIRPEFIEGLLAPKPASEPTPFEFVDPAVPADDELPPLLVLPKPDPTPKKVLERPPAPLTADRGATCADVAALTDARQTRWPVGDTVFGGTVTREGHWFRIEDPADHDDELGGYAGLVRTLRPCVEAEWTSLWTDDDEVTAWYRGDYYVFVSSEDTDGGLGLAVVDRRSITR